MPHFTEGGYAVHIKNKLLLQLVEFSRQFVETIGQTGDGGALLYHQTAQSV